MNDKLLNPLQVSHKAKDGTEYTYNLGQYPAIAGREIICKYPLSAIPKLGDYEVNEATMLKLMSYVERVMPDGNTVRLTTRALVDNHVPDAEVLMQLERGSLQHNVSFFGSDAISRFLEGIAAKSKPLVMKTLTDLLAQSSAKKQRPSKS